VTDDARADELFRRQVVLTWVSAVVVLVTLSAVALALFLIPASSRAWATAAAAVGAAVVAVLLAILVRHAVRLAAFTFRREVT
jgi:membrane protein YdbS with pleckstrin-like domain